MAMLGVICALEKDNERIRVINKQYKMKYESQRIYLEACEEIPISWKWRVKKQWESGPVLNYENISTSVKT